MLCNDATAACAAESSSAAAGAIATSSIFSSASFSAAGLALDGALRPGRTGNAAALGSMPILAKSAVKSLGSSSRARQSIDWSVDGSGWPRLLVDLLAPELLGEFGAQLDSWIEDSASALAYATVAAISVIDFEAIVIDGALPRRCVSASPPDDSGLRWPRSARLERGRYCFRLDRCRRGVDRAAALPLIKQFARDREVLFKDAMRQAS